MRVLISGAGIAGPTLAFFLAKAGMQITIIEKSPQLLTQGQSIDFKGSANTIIKKMGLMRQIREASTAEKGSCFIDQQGRPFAPFPVDENHSLSLTAQLEILRGNFAAVLYRATKDHPNITYTFGTTIRKVISNDDDSVKVELSKGVQQEFDLLVAADGQWSGVRKQCFPTDSVKVLDKDMYVAYWTVPRVANDNDWWNIHIAPGSRLISIRPDPHGTMRAMISRMPTSDAQRKEWAAATRSDRQTQERLLRNEFGSVGWEAPRLLNAMEETPEFYFHAI